MPTGREVVDTIREAFELFSEMELPLKEREVTIMYGAALPLIGYIERLEAAQLKWISVEEGVPEYWVDVLAVCDGKVYSGWRSLENAWMLTSKPNAEVTHWMPLPEPPKEET